MSVTTAAFEKTRIVFLPAGRSLSSSCKRIRTALVVGAREEWECRMIGGSYRSTGSCAGTHVRTVARRVATAEVLILLWVVVIMKLLVVI